MYYLPNCFQQALRSKLEILKFPYQVRLQHNLDSCKQNSFKVFINNTSASAIKSFLLRKQIAIFAAFYEVQYGLLVEMVTVE